MTWSDGLNEWVRVLPLILLVMGSVAGAMVWYSPSGCGWVAQVLRARKAGLEAYRKTYNELRPGRQRVIGYGENNQPIRMPMPIPMAIPIEDIAGRIVWNEDADGVAVAEDGPIAS